ncbi:antibiotic biosynthesis monooxygenase [Viridibacillus arvi]|uniref:antibiotic biosynthesis monooxygenase n=1 Tax=Viridibacillus arvi TaxID=263475 RepID=UPI003D06EBF0
MYNVTNVIRVKKGFVDALVERFENVNSVLKFDGFLGMEVMVTIQNVDFEEVSIFTRWDKKENFMNWMKSDDFKRRHSGANARPDFILNNKVIKYDVRISKVPEVITS